MSWPTFWQRNTPLTWLLWPFSRLYLVLSHWHQQRLQRQQRTFAVPIIVVGNIVVGGTGKTPFIAWLVQQLMARGERPALVSRGYGGQHRGPLILAAGHTAVEVGDEPLLLAQLTQVPVCIGRDRVAAVEHLLQAHPEITVILSDDGLQHRSLPRDLEICLFDGQAGVGNAQVLPAGPLRESLPRLQQIPLVVSKGPPNGEWWAKVSAPLVMQFELAPPVHVRTGVLLDSDRMSVADDLVALCGIGQPASFFSALRAQGWSFTPMALRDHQPLSAEQLQGLAGKTVLMTSKDAIKLKHATLPFDAYEVPMQPYFSPTDEQQLLSTVSDRIRTKRLTCTTPNSV